MIADAVRSVGGDRVAVRALMGPGVDPHAFRQTRSDIVAMTRADLVLYHGLDLEAQMIPFFADLAGRTSVVAVAEALPQDQLLADEDYENRFDHHVWMAPSLWQGVIDQVTAALITAAPADAEVFRAQAEAYKTELADLATYATQSLASVPEERRILVTAHDAFNYFGAAYGYEVQGIQGISTEREAGLNRIAELVDQLVSGQIGAVFVESSVSARNIRELIEGAAAQGHDVRIGGELFSDAMGSDGSYEGPSLGMIAHNVTTLAAAMGGTVPARGRLGKLEAGS